MAIVIKRYESYIADLSMRKLRDERGNIYYGIDGDIQDRLRSKLMQGRPFVQDLAAPGCAPLSPTAMLA